MEITDIKRHLSIKTVLQHYNLVIDRNNHIRCPFHADDTPSCRIYPSINTFYCFGCGATGDQIELVQRLEGCSKHKALVKAAALIDNGQLIIDNETSRNGKTQSLTELQSCGLTVCETEVLTRAFTHFARSLKVKPHKAIAYLESRKLDYKALSIGFDSGTLHKTDRKSVREEDRKNDENMKQEYLQAGLLKPDKFNRPNCYYTRFNNCIVFPLLDREGNIASLYGRHIESGHHYLEGEYRGLYPGYPKPIPRF